MALKAFLPMLAVAALSFAADEKGSAPVNAPPVRGLHSAAPKKGEVEACEKFIRTALPKEGVNYFILEVNYNFAYASHPELGNPKGLSAADVKRLLGAARAAGVKLVPQFNCLGHQSWKETTFALLKKHPEFDETPHLPADNKGLYCRSWCPLHPDVHPLVFALLDELAEAFEAEDVHVGMDEVFILADPKCPRCAGKDPAELFAGEVKALRDHLAEKKRRLWMWGDRFLDGRKPGLGEWEAAVNGTHPALEKAPKDLVICDWHYDKAWETPQSFIEKGLAVVSCPWKNSAVALQQLKNMRAWAADPAAHGKAFGMLQTTWVPFAEFLRAYEDQDASPSAKESAACFKKLFAALRQGG